ncbi:hypothetical protein IWW55_000258 [Coemansia sp. RSA 2706]|nr:hypothetical protein IWW55_000258 [Coemansia sp. RSA 2706]KAJ2315440.1 hypothetical protein IWW54_000281 [Coemansia sp. RSA 2705]KAJ2322326.1 hypothetical protein IWW52_000159 [Coemansia sp. RSA 2704]KAJ2329925.1 hypothetical protein IWW51_000295 [Coemansia sp. RSA 2702]KAJ2370450.1 hypothetical protein H4S01_000361 [Coemansia sp. RSA 2610]KAJ2393677.1 hypothetical protein H4S02_000039 [Coemansia sp. RSA 2611]KAJ2739896.1 hypothetical protein H4R23_000136 [Coemansia sp. Cherry 401B]
MQPKIVSLASINIDEVYRVPHIVRPGETLASTGRQQTGGGKGANASVAAARAGGTVHVVGKIGADGRWLRDQLRESGAHVEQITETGDAATGRALIQVDSSGENSIVLSPGANHCIGDEDVRRALAQCGAGDWLMLTNETSGVRAAIELARAARMQVLWNPAPMSQDLVAARMPVELVDVLVVNQSELALLAAQLPGARSSAGDETGCTQTAQAVMRRLGTRVVAVTMGSHGSVAVVRRPAANPHEIPVGDSSSNSSSSSGQSEAADLVTIRQPCAPISQAQVIDTTAAGDAWVGYFVAELARRQADSPESVGALAAITPKMVECAMRVATYASAIAVTRRGAFASIPSRLEVDAFIASQ